MKYILALISFYSIQAFAQIDGDNLFAVDQVVEIRLNFSQVSYWDSLVANYETESYMSADLTISDVTGTTIIPNVGVRFKGNSTYNHPNNKKPLKIDFNEYVSGQNYNGIKKLNLSNCFKDPSMMREKLFFDLCQEAQVLAPRANFANVYINDELWGFYTMVEQIDDQFLDWAILDDDGNLFKAGDNFGGGPGGAGTPADLVYYGTDTSNYTERYELKTNETANDWTDLVTLMDYINNSSSSTFETEFDTRFEGTEMLRSFALDNLFSNLDSYLNSARNYYLYHNATSDKWEWIKWDANETFGSYGGGVDVLNLTWDYHASDRPLLDQIFNNETLADRYKTELCELMQTYFNSAYLDPIIDSYYELIKSDVYADSRKMYTDANFDAIINSNISVSSGPMGPSTVYGLKPFIASRYSSMQSQLDCGYYLSLEEAAAEIINYYPNPFTNAIHFEVGEEIVDGTIELIDLMGKVVQITSIYSTHITAETNQLKSGYYIALIKDSKGLVQHQLKVQKH